MRIPDELLVKQVVDEIRQLRLAVVGGAWVIVIALTIIAIVK